MSTFVDTGVFYAAFDSAASRHQTARRALTTVLRDASFGRVVTNEYVYDETITLTAQRTGSTQRAVEVGERLRSESDEGGTAVTIVYSTQALFDAAVDVFEQYADHSLSFTDAMTVATVDHRNVDAVLSFDDDFDAVVERMDPSSVAD